MAFIPLGFSILAVFLQVSIFIDCKIVRVNFVDEDVPPRHYGLFYRYNPDPASDEYGCIPYDSAFVSARLRTARILACAAMGISVIMTFLHAVNV